MIAPIDITVRYVMNTYQTNTVNKMRASATSGAAQAAMALGRKLFGDSFAGIEGLGDGPDHNTTRFRLYAKVPPEATIAALRAALADACNQIEGWVNWKCPKKHVAEHMANIAKLRELLK